VAKLARVLKTDIMADLDMKGLAQLLRSLGRKGDKILAHITPKEAEKLEKEGGAGTINPSTGLPEFYDGEDFTLPEEVNVPEAGGQAPVPDYYPDTSAAPAAIVEPPSDVPATTYGDYSLANIATVAGRGGQGLGRPADYVTSPELTSVRDLQLGGLGAGTPAPKLSTEGLTTEEKPFWKDLITKDALKLGMGGVGALVAGLQGRAAQKRAQEAAAQTAAIGTPYQTEGRAQMAAAQRGELTPERQQTLQAAQAQIAQGIERRGGVGAMQAATQLQSFRNQLLQDQYNYGLKVAQIGDSYAANAIKVGLTQDQAVAQAMRGLAANLGQFAA
jgi:hypothetical protein